jgi:hypothetical protein
MPPIIGQVIDGQVFTSEKDVPMTFMGIFKNCEFNMDELKDRNFFSAKFVDCKFANDFMFVHCNLGHAEGVDDVKMKACLRISQKSEAMKNAVEEVKHVPSINDKRKR